MIRCTDIYLVDCENFGCKRLVIENDTSIIYYFTSNSISMPNLYKFEHEVHIIHDNNKDILDFIIDSKLGYLLCHYGKNVNFHIVSNDTGFNVVVDYWKSQGYQVERVDSDVFLRYYIVDGEFATSDVITDKYNSIMASLGKHNQDKINNVFNHWLKVFYVKKYSDLATLINDLNLGTDFSKKNRKFISKYLYYFKFKGEENYE